MLWVNLALKCMPQQMRPLVDENSFQTLIFTSDVKPHMLILLVNACRTNCLPISPTRSSMSNPTVTFYPVGNGDATLIRLDDGLTILVDCNIREARDDDGNDTYYDVKKDLLELLRDEDGVPHLDVFVLTHPDLDHCRGYQRDFYRGDPTKYSQTDKVDRRIVIDQMWFAPRIFQDHEDLNDEAAAIKKELDRRKTLHLSGGSAKDTAGNRLWCIGYSNHDDIQGLDDIRTVAGQSLSTFNGQDRDDLTVFIFAPVKRDSDGEKSERNDTSVALAAEFHLDGVKAACRTLLLGDNSRVVLERIYDKNKDNGHLEYDVLLAPHHCSWGTFSDTKGGRVSTKVHDLLKKKRDGAHIVVSSKPIKDDDAAPPSYPARVEYLKVVDVDHFTCTEEWPNEKQPVKLVFNMTADGAERVTPDDAAKSKASTRASAAAAARTPTTYGRR